MAAVNLPSPFGLPRVQAPAPAPPAGGTLSPWMTRVLERVRAQAAAGARPTPGRLTTAASTASMYAAATAARDRVRRGGGY